jgi:putative transposase
VASSTWYAYCHRKLINKEDQRKFNPGRPIPGTTSCLSGVPIPDDVVVDAITKYRGTPEFANGGGCKKMRFYLENDYGYIVNRKKIYRLCKANNLLLPRRKKDKKRNRKICSNRVVIAPNVLWEFDIKYGFIHGENRYFFVLLFIDVYSRKIVGHYVGTSCTGTDVKFTLDQAIKNEKLEYGFTLTIRSDNGTQMTSNVFTEYMSTLAMNVDHEFIPPSTPNKNAHIESFNSIFEIEFLQTRYFRNFAQAYKETGEFILFYNTRRIHGSLAMRSPCEALSLMQAGCLRIAPVRL